MTQYVPLVDVCEITMGQAPVGTSYNENEEGYALIAGAGDFGKITPEPKKHTVKPTRISQPNDLILCIRATIGDLNWSDKKYCLGRGVAGLRPITSKLDRNYLWHFIASNKDQLKARGTGSTFKQVSRSHIEEWELPLPPLKEQKRIAAILDKADAIRRKRQQAIDLTDQLLRSVFLDMFGDTSGFGMVEIKEIAAKKKYSLSSGPFGSNLTSKHYESDGVIVLRGTNVTSGQLDLGNVKYISERKADELKRSKVCPDDIVIVAVGASGHAFKIPKSLSCAVMSQNFNKVTPDKEKVTPTYLEYCFNSQLVQRQFKQNITDTVRTFLSLTKIKEVKIPLPPLVLQIQFEKIVNQIHVSKTKLENMRLESENLLQSLTQQAFRGELSKQAKAA